MARHQVLRLEEAACRQRVVETIAKKQLRGFLLTGECRWARSKEAENLCFLLQVCDGIL
jgi:hypothetical protein